MKVLTITFHSAVNYGAVLQCYALQQAIMPYANEVRTVDFRTPAMKYAILPKMKGIKGVARKILTLKDYRSIKRKHELFSEFVKDNINLTRHYGSIEDLEKIDEEEDIIFTGSDQVFNPNRRQDERRAYYLDFPCRYKASYSASFGNSNMPEERSAEVKSYLEKMDFIAVREEYAVQMIEKLTGRTDVSHTIDPVFLLKKTEWESMEEKYPGIPEKYVLFFNLRESKTAVKIAKNLIDKTGLPLVMITGKPNPPIHTKYTIRDCGPKQFLWLINHCTYFIEDSFHATAFSIIFEKQFLFCDDHEKSYERGRALLDRLGLAECYNFVEWESLLEKKIDFHHANLVLKEDIDASIDYLKYCIDNSRNTGKQIKRKKVGIITYSDSLNWGAQLQSYALREAVDSISPEIFAKQIDHRRMNTNRYRKRLTLKNVASNLVAWYTRNEFDTRCSRTVKFRDKYLSMTCPCHTDKDMENLNNEFDLFISGSDQVFNCSKGINKNFYLDFVRDPDKKCAYAASFGIPVLPNEYKTQALHRLETFRYISVRENTGQNILRDIQRYVPTACDPVFLIAKERWEKVITESSKANPAGSYIFVYSTENSLEFIRVVAAVKRKYRLPVVSVTGIPGCQIVKDLGPAEFIHYIHDAELVVTTSFHACAFSIIFEKKFVVYPHKSTGNRVTNILDRLDLMGQVIERGFKGEVPIPDYRKICSILNVYRQESIKCVTSILNGESNKIRLKNIDKFKDTCTGCEVCVSVCPKKCISMEADDDGFLYPHINQKDCISCARCVKSCHLSKNIKSEGDETGIYGWALEQNLRREGSSGGAFSAIAEAIAKNKKSYLWVFGSVTNLDKWEIHQKGFLYPDYKALCQSKYVFSNPENTFLEVKEKLAAGFNVVYCGTPCQIGALNQYMIESPDELLTVDFICHGVPSQKFFFEHLNFITRGNKVNNVEFRSKVMGWGLHKYCLLIDYVDGNKYIQKAGKDFFFTHFLQGDCLRLGCYQCQYSYSHRSDLTLGDFWEIEKYRPELNDGKGISVVFANTEKGMKALDLLKNEMEWYPIPESYKRSRCGCNPNKLVERTDFLNTYKTVGLEKMEKSFAKTRYLRLIKKGFSKYIH